jgi:hypothetical protein
MPHGIDKRWPGMAEKQGSPLAERITPHDLFPVGTARMRAPPAG